MLTRSQAARATLVDTAGPINPVGYIVLRDAVAVDPDTVVACRHEARQRARAIFNNEGSPNDRRRKQASLGRQRLPKRIRKVVSDAAAAVRSVYPNLEVKVNGSVVLFSDAGCKQQSPHADYKPELLRGLPDAVAPHGVLVALEDDTTLDVWPGSHLTDESVPHVRVCLNPGDVLLFRGDLVHAGSAYPDKENVRLHCFADHVGSVRKQGATYPVDSKLYPLSS